MSSIDNFLADAFHIARVVGRLEERLSDEDTMKKVLEFVDVPFCDQSPSVVLLEMILDALIDKAKRGVEESKSG